MLSMVFFKKLERSNKSMLAIFGVNCQYVIVKFVHNSLPS